MKSNNNIAIKICALMLVFVSFSKTVFAAGAQKFLVNYEANLTIDSKRASNTGLSQGVISALTGIMGGSISIAHVKDTVSISKDFYQIQSSGTLGSVLGMFMSGSLERTSVGSISGGTLNTLRYVDVRGSNPALITLIDEKTKTVFFYEGKRLTGRVAFQSKPQDVLSLSYAFIGHIPTQPFSVALSDGKSIKLATFDVKSESLTVPSGQWKATKITRRISSLEDASVEFWLRSTDGAPLRMRIGMNQRYGATLDLRSTQIPANILPL